ncbi:MAG: peroxiredoxin [Clostridia bacterium]
MEIIKDNEHEKNIIEETNEIVFTETDRACNTYGNTCKSECVCKEHTHSSPCYNLRLGDTAPYFECNTTFGPCQSTDFKGKWLVFFSHPSDFTPVCSSEFLAFSKYHGEFQKRNCNLLGLSVDSNSSHIAWVNDICKTTGCQIPFPLASDPSMDIAKKYGMIAPNISTTKTVRSVFIICPKQTIKAILTYPATNGRNIAEILRLLDALQLTDTENLYTPAGWNPGMPAVVPAPATYQELCERVQNPGDLSCYSWYLCFKQPSAAAPTMSCANPCQDPCSMPNNCCGQSIMPNTCCSQGMMPNKCQVPLNC